MAVSSNVEESLAQGFIPFSNTQALRIAQCIPLVQACFALPHLGATLPGWISVTLIIH